jgi:hypothetical protein
MDFVPIAALGFLVNKVTDFLKYVRNKDWNAALTQLEQWGGGVASVFVASAANLTRGVGVGDLSLGDLNSASKVLLGMTIASVGSFAYDWKKASDNTDSAAAPALFPELAKTNSPAPARVAKKAASMS